MDNPELQPSPTPDLEAVSNAYKDILAHNSRHTGLGAALRAAISGAVKGANDPAAGSESTKVEGDMDAELQDIFHSDTFMRAGIKIAPFGSYVTSGESRVTTSTELTPLIENTVLFTEFLSKLQPEAVQQDETAKRFFGDVVANLAKVTSLCFDPEAQKEIDEAHRPQLVEAAEDALRSFTAIEPEYARQGIDSAAYRARVKNISPDLSAYMDSRQGGAVPRELTDEYSDMTTNQERIRLYERMARGVHYWGRNVLPEYLMADDKQYLTPPDEHQFGPSEWQRHDGQWRWAEAFHFLDRLDRDERTKGFASDVRHGLTTAVDAALAEAEDTSRNASDALWKNQRDDLVNLRNALSGHPFNQKQLTAYIKKPVNES